MGRKTGKSTLKLTFCAICTALGVIILTLCAVVDVLDLSCAALAGMITGLIAIEIGGFWPFSVYFATAVISTLLLPSKWPGLFYLVFAGWYPFAKSKIERIKPKALGMVVKMALLNLSVFLLFVVARFVLMLPGESEKMTIALYVMVNVAFILYDIALSRLVLAYIHVIRGRLRMDRFDFKK